MNRVIQKLGQVCLIVFALVGPSHARAAQGLVPLESTTVGVGSISVPVLAYHNVLLSKDEDDFRESVTVDDLSRHFAWLAAKGYTPITSKQLEAGITNPASLPPKPIMLTFDDGFESMYVHVLPLLRAYQWHAVTAIVGSWVEARERDNPSLQKGKPRYLNKREIKELNESGFVEFASHTYDLHHGIVANAWGNEQPAAVTRVWTPSGSETDEHWHTRVASDIAQNQAYIQKLTGKAPSMLMWPYGRYNEELKSIAKEQGLSTLFTLEDGVSDVATEKSNIRRHLVTRDEQESALASLLETPDTPVSIIRAVRLQVDDLQEPLPVSHKFTGAKAEVSSMSQALDELLALGGNAVILDPFVHTSGKVSAALFANSVLPVSRDYANRLAAVTAGKAGYRTWLSVSLNKLDYAVKTQSDVLKLVEDAAKAVPLAGLVIENAQAVDAKLINEAVARVTRWRSSPQIILSWSGALEPRAKQIMRDTHAQFFLASPYEKPTNNKTLQSQLIVEVPIDSTSAIENAEQAGYVSFSLKGLPTVNLDWLTAFSLRGKPLHRISVPGAANPERNAR